MYYIQYVLQCKIFKQNLAEQRYKESSCSRLTSTLAGPSLITLHDNLNCSPKNPNMNRFLAEQLAAAEFNACSVQIAHVQGGTYYKNPNIIL
jgi:hypothetical protein